jgi:hypothetical protein
MTSSLGTILDEGNWSCSADCSRWWHCLQWHCMQWSRCCNLIHLILPLIILAACNLKTKEKTSEEKRKIKAKEKAVSE